MIKDTTAEFVASLRKYRLLPPSVEDVPADLLARCAEPRALVKELLERNWLTAYQVNQLLTGKGHDLLLGSYVLLERIGEGGMGAVFKARNWKLGQVVALKLIRKERLQHPTAILRFQREIRAVAQLDHPNIVRAFDADQVGGVNFFVMEHVLGTDLAKTVKQQGPLPVAAACDYIRQAALGLQHAHERGLVHRDIKPANLLVTNLAPRESRGAKYPVVKILDMGLARLSHEGDADHSTTLTQEGSVMGTADYLSPEQSLESHTVDIRSDLYSLGCTMYFLLAGRVPFPGGTMAHKLMKHQTAEPTPLRQLRPEVPEAVAGIVRKLMAKRPEERYATPAELAQALEEYLTPQGPTISITSPRMSLANPGGRATPSATMELMPQRANPFADLGADRSEALEPARAPKTPISILSGPFHK